MCGLGDTADVQLNAYAQRAFHGPHQQHRQSSLDATIRTAPVRIVLQNPGIMRAGMFVTATLYGQHGRMLASVPSSAVLHLHDRDWVFVSAGSAAFRRTEITSGNIFERETRIFSLDFCPASKLSETPWRYRPKASSRKLAQKSTQ